MMSQETIHALFEAQSNQRPDHVALVYGGVSLTYGALNKKANQLAHYLRDMGVTVDTPVALCMERSMACLITLFAILKAGGAYVPLDMTQPEERLRFILNETKSPILILTSRPEAQFVSYQGLLIILNEDEEKISHQPTHNPTPLATASDLAYVIYTSGSTGTPKGILIEHGSVVNYAHWFANYSHCQLQQRIDFSSNYMFDMAVTTSLVPLALGLTIVLCSDAIKRDIRDYVGHLIYNKANIIKITPSYFKVLLDEVKTRPVALLHLQTLILGGENLSTVDCASWLARYPDHTLINEYGPTEATVAVLQHTVSHRTLSVADPNVPIGKPGLDMHCHILGADLSPLAAGELGELYIGGICLARGYLNQPELTRTCFITDPFGDGHARLYKTGDLCCELPDGSIAYYGRMDAQLKIRGFRIEPGDIEKQLMIHPAIHDVVVLPREEHLQEKRLIAYYILKKESADRNPGQFRQYLQAHLPEYMIPSAFVRIDAFPLTANGKLDQSALPIPQFFTSQYYVAPTTELEKILAAIWSEELHIKTIGIEDDFFELGGHSLSAARIISKINHTLRTDMRLHDFYVSPTIRSLVCILNTEIDHDEKNSNQRKRGNNLSADIPLSDFQLMLWMSHTFEPKVKKLNITVRKRMQGSLNRDALAFAFDSVFSKHDILSYRVFKLRPMQRVEKKRPIQMLETHMEHLSEAACELALDTSIQELRYHYPWHKKEPMVIVRIFYLPAETIELQLCMPHIISDDCSPDILLKELSTYYLLYDNQPVVKPLRMDEHYRNYLSDEYYYSKENCDSDLRFWKEYLNDAYPFTFPPEHIVTEIRPKMFSYSTYLEVPKEGLDHLQRFCAKNRISMDDGLCAALMLALSLCSDKNNNITQPIFMNRVKSTRNKSSYDGTIGCFLRMEPIKVSLHKKSTLTTLSKEIHQAAIDVSPYQQCSGLLKFACIKMFCRDTTVIRNYFMNIFTFLYAKIYPRLLIHRHIFNLCKLSSLQSIHGFFININVNSNFMSEYDKDKETMLFGLKTKKTENKPYDLLAMDYLFDVCFLRDEDKNIPYLVISANLEPVFRERIAKKVIEIMSSE